MDSYTIQSLDYARYLAECGVPIFLAWPTGDGSFDFPKRWQHTVADPAILDDWKPGMAVCAVMGNVVDGLDIDTDKGGSVPDDLMPVSYGRQRTPSGGTHDLIASLGVRSRDGILTGVDLKAGTADAVGTGMLFIAPTQRLGGKYVWEQPPALEPLLLIGDDDSGTKLAQLVSERPTTPTAAEYTGPDYADLTSEYKALADSILASKLDYWETLLNQAKYWPEGHTDHEGRGWFWITNGYAWMLACMAATPWIGLTEEQAREQFYNGLPAEMRSIKKCTEHWNNGIVNKAAASSDLELPPWEKYDTVDLQDLSYPVDFSDAALVDWVAREGLKERWIFTAGMGWFFWDERQWTPRGEVSATEAVRKLIMSLHLKAITQNAEEALTKAIRNLTSTNRIRALVTLLRGRVEIDATVLDDQPDLLNVANGVLDLRTGKLMPHHPEYYFTKMTSVPYIPGATHKDFDQVLTCLEPEVIEWMQIRFGQAATGYQTSDDVLPIGQGDGANGKTTLISTVRNALGPFAVAVPERLIQPHTGVPTEKMVLKGARLALIDETPEAAYLDMQVIKSIVGSDKIVARALYKDNVEWEPTHSLMVMTNYAPSIRETDKGVWRRLALVRFDKTFKRNDQFRTRMSRGEDGRSEAALAWIVEGAKKWYDQGRYLPKMPDKVYRDTQAWRGREDLLLSYAQDRLEFVPNSAILASELLADLNQWLESSNHRTWSSNLVSTRIESHELFKENHVQRSRGFTADIPLDTKYGEVEPGTRARTWRGLKWKRD